MQKENIYYKRLCHSAMAYKKGIISQPQLLNNISEFVVLKLDSTIMPQVSLLTQNLERKCLNGRF